jgi:peptide/nickel transport system substrate-binding protein/oligopeptide transport system substrate-binding protein
LRYDSPTGNLKPLIARNWGFSKDGKSAVIMLSGNVYFHNGKRLQAIDVKRSWERTLKRSADWQTSNLFSCIKGSQAFIMGSSDEITGIRVEKGNTLSIDFSRPDAAFFYKITNPAFWVVDADDKSEIPSGTGPFKLSVFHPGQDLALERFKNYHGTRPLLERLLFTFYPDEYQGLAAYQKGKLDYLNAVPLSELKNLAADKNYQSLLVKTPIMGFYALAMNVSRAPFNELELRRAMNYCIDRDSLVNSIMAGAGIPAKGVLPVGLPGYNRAMSGYAWNHEKAIELMKETRYLNSLDPPVVKLAFNENQGHERLAQAVKEQMESIGIKVELAPMPWKNFESELTSMDLSLFRLGWEADYPDPDDFLYSLFHSKQIGTGNFTGYINLQVDRVLDAARAESRSPDERMKLLQRAEQMIVDDAPMVWLFQKEDVGILGPNAAGFEMDGMRMINWSALTLKDTPAS